MQKSGKIKEKGVGERGKRWIENERIEGKDGGWGIG